MLAFCPQAGKPDLLSMLCSPNDETSTQSVRGQMLESRRNTLRILSTGSPSCCGQRLDSRTNILWIPGTGSPFCCGASWPAGSR